MPIKLFEDGEILDASDVNTYFMDQALVVFDSAAQRDAAFGGTVNGIPNEPALAEGRICYLKDDDTLYIYTGAAWTAQLATIADGLITTAKLNGTAGSEAVTTAKIRDLNVTEGKLADSSVTSAKIVNGTIVNADINASAAIELGKLANISIDIKTSNYPLVLTDANKLIEMNLTGTANTVSVPTNASVAFPIGTQITIVQYGTGKTQIVATTPGTTNIRHTPGSYLRDQYSSATLIKRATDEWYLIGDLSAT